LLTLILEYSNYFFTGLFALEMMLKMMAVGIFGYFNDGFNVFDGGIVVIRSVETPPLFKPDNFVNSTSTASALFRL